MATTIQDLVEVNRSVLSISFVIDSSTHIALRAIPERHNVRTFADIHSVGRSTIKIMIGKCPASCQKIPSRRKKKKKKKS